MTKPDIAAAGRAAQNVLRGFLDHAGRCDAEVILPGGRLATNCVRTAGHDGEHQAARISQVWPPAKPDPR